MINNLWRLLKMMYAKWIAEDKYNAGTCVIKKGEIRKIHAKSNNQYILESKNGKGYFGWIDEKDIELCQEGEMNVKTNANE